MSQRKHRFVLLSQKALLCGTMLAVAAPSLTVSRLDIVGPGTEQGGTVDRRPVEGALVASEPVRPEVTEEPVAGVEPEGLEVLSSNPKVQRRARHDLAVLSAPEPVEGFATVGVTWRPGEVDDDSEITVSVRTLEDGTWSAWQEVEYHDDHGPDPDSPEARNARPGTDAVVVGDVDEVQMKAVTETGEAPEGMRLAVVEPGETEGQVVEEPAIDTASLASAGFTAEDDAELAANVTPRPRIFSRAQWGADERLRDGSPSYFEVHAGFVHHTVNANNYTRAQVPGIIRGIYAYHTQSRGWSDVGYNFLVDKFGRIWEGRYGGVARPVVGAHTLGYNDYAFAMSAIGNFETVMPSSAMLEAYGRLMAWKLSLHGVDAGSRYQRVAGEVMPAINGHRDVGQTACPGRHLYARIDTIRTLANRYQAPFGPRDLATDLSGSRWPDLLATNRFGRVKVVRTGGVTNFGRRLPSGRGWQVMDRITVSRDLTGDGVPDVLARERSTRLSYVYAGDGEGGFSHRLRGQGRFSSFDSIVSAGDLNRDGRNDIVGVDGVTKQLFFFPGKGDGFFLRRRVMQENFGWATKLMGVGNMVGDGAADLATTDSRGRLYLWQGDGRGGLERKVYVSHGWDEYDLISGLGDLTNDGRPDILARDASTRLTYVFPGFRNGRVGAPRGPYRQFKDVDWISVTRNMRGNWRDDVLARGGGGNLVVFPNNARRNIASVVSTNVRVPDMNLVLNVGDWDGDGHGDMMYRRDNGNLYFRAGQGGSFGAEVRAGVGWQYMEMVRPAGDVTGDGSPDLMAQRRGGAMRIYAGDGRSGFSAWFVAHSEIPGRLHMGVGLWQGDGAPDSIFAQSDGDLVLYPGNGPGGLTDPRKVGGGTGRYDVMLGIGDADGDGRNDIVARARASGHLWLLPGTRSSVRPRLLLGEGFQGFELIG